MDMSVTRHAGIYIYEHVSQSVCARMCMHVYI